LERISFDGAWYVIIGLLPVEEERDPSREFENFIERSRI
jgi:hypothetical protein